MVVVRAGLAPLLNIVCRMRMQSMQLDCRRLSLFVKRILVHAAEFYSAI